MHVYLQYAENGGDFSDWVEYETILGMDNRYTTEISMTGLNYQSSFTFRAMARDLLSEALSPQKTVKTMPVFDWGEKDFNFNVPVSIHGHALDYVVEQGTDGIWTYRKWNSGIAECWGVYKTTSETLFELSISLGSCTISFPFAFLQKPVVTASFGASNLARSHIAYVDTTKEGVNIYGNLEENAVGIDCWFNICAVGRWKE